MTGCATTFRAGAPNGAIDVISHRGASEYAPENTLAAFKLAIDQHADWFELDCTLSKDGAVVVIHDDSVERVTGVPGNVQDFTLDELKKLDAGAWFDPKFAGERLPTLAEALDLAKGRIGVYIEIKNSADDSALLKAGLALANPDRDRFTPHERREMVRRIEASGTRNLELTRKVIALVRERAMEHQVVLQSFSPIVCMAALSDAPDLRTEFLANEDEKDPGRWPFCLRWLYLMNAKGFNVSRESLSPERLANFHRTGRTVAVWTVDEPGEIRRYADWGVDAIISNRPDVCLKVLSELGKH